MTKTQSKVPQLGFPEFKLDRDYETYLFEDIFLFSSGKNIKQDEASPEYEIPCVRYGELYHLYDEVITKTINKTNLDESDLTFSEGNEILLPSAGEDPLDIGSASALTLKDVAIGRTINVLRPKGEIAYSHIYVSYYINKKLRRKISTIARGASISNVYNSDLKTLKINLPEIQEQNKIVSFVTTVDNKISLLKQKHEQLVQYQKGIMQQLFSQQLRFKDDNGQDFPDWKRECLGDFITVRKGETVTEEMPLHSLTIKSGIEPKSARYVRDFLVNDTSEAYKVVLPGDFAMNPMNLRFGAIARHSGDGKVLLSKYYDVFYFNDALDHEFMENYLKSHSMIGFYNKMATGTLEEKKRVHFSDFAKFRRLIPCYLEQKVIAGFLKPIDQKINLVQQQIEQTQAYKQGLLQQMFI